MTENKQITDVWCSETGEIGFTKKGIDKKFLSHEFEDWLNNLINENDELKKENKRLKRLTAPSVIVDANVIAETIARCRGITVEEYLEEIEEEYTKEGGKG